MKLTGKCKTDFEKWFIDKYDSDKVHETIMLITEFYNLPQSMQFGVLVEFFDSVGIYVNDQYGYIVKTTYSFKIVNKKTETILNYKSEFKTRQEARQKAILKANKIYNTDK